MNHLKAACIGFLLWHCLSGTTRADEASDRRINWGEGVGHIHLGMILSDAEKLLGKPSTAGMAVPGTYAHWYQLPKGGGPREETDLDTSRVAPLTGIQLKDGDYAVEQITVTASFFCTPGGSSTASLPGAVWKEFPGLRFLSTSTLPDHTAVELYDDTEKGIAFLITRAHATDPGASWGKIRAIVVHRRGVEATLTQYFGEHGSSDAYW